MVRRLGIIILIFIAIISYRSAEAQQVRGAVIGGINLAQVDGDEIFGFNKFGGNLGLGAVVPIGNNLNFSIETIFSQKGSYQSAQYNDVDSLGNVTTGAYNLSLNYLEVPFLLFYNDKNVISGGAGFSYARLVGIKEYEHGSKIETTTLNTGPYDKNDFSILADVRFRMYKRFMFNIRYAYSLAKIRTREFEDLLGNTWERKQYNNTISFRIIYMFNEKPPVADSKNNNSGF
ncbi:MAG: outer membrane beta-barrel protein [Bacteroidales bacterium]|nr:outer membrane beta-barrel protein [Bacteroidales bacterium]